MAESNDHQGHRERLRERFRQAGFSGLAEHEVVEIVLTLCIPRRDVKPIAKALLKRFGNLRGIFFASPEELMSVKGVGESTPVNLHIIRDAFGLALRQEIEGTVVLDSVKKLVAFWQSRIATLRYEVFEAAYLDNRHRLVRNGVVRLSAGTIDRTAVFPRSVAEQALKLSAKNVVLAHNHPSGKLQPSREDLRLTQMIQEALKPLDIGVLEHLIVAGGDYYSFRHNDLL
ncbi:MAG: DNA repair protein RadC [Opitutales bacterium]